MIRKFGLAFNCKHSYFEFSLIRFRYADHLSRSRPCYLDVDFQNEIYGFQARDLRRMEVSFKILDLYLWLSLRYPNIFPDGELARQNSNLVSFEIQMALERQAALVDY